jgi:hypothetical protein
MAIFLGLGSCFTWIVHVADVYTHAAGQDMKVASHPVWLLARALWVVRVPLEVQAAGQLQLVTHYWLPPQLLCTPHSKGTPLVLWLCWAG